MVAGEQGGQRVDDNAAGRGAVSGEDQVTAGVASNTASVPIVARGFQGFISLKGLSDL